MMRGAILVMVFILGQACGLGGTMMAYAQQTACPETLYASVLSTRKHQLSGTNPVIGLFYSSDDGQTWQHTGWEQGKTFAAMSVPGTCGDTLFIAAGNGVMRTTDGGQFWQIVTGWRVTEVQDVAVNPMRPNQVFAATPYGLFRSDDLGETWQERSTGLTATFAAAVRADRTHPDRVFAGMEDGLFVSDDAGEQWQPTAIREPVQSVRQSPADPQRWVGGLQDRGVALSTDGGRTWRYGEGAVEGFTIYESEWHPTDPDVLYAGGWGTGVLRSDDAGRTWHRSTEGLDDLSLNVHSLAISRRQPDLVFAGTMGGGLYRSQDAGRTWTPVAPAVFDASQVWDLFVEGE